jgi:hypothetical protein
MIKPLTARLAWGVCALAAVLTIAALIVDMIGPMAGRPFLKGAVRNRLALVIELNPVPPPDGARRREAHDGNDHTSIAEPATDPASRATWVVARRQRCPARP